ncbi:hypothetical protein BC828DRAFT_228574 [Blastocladiella britannica]|nr:hypothetical protein BC828DRAFT_228574 [Blastocladiella britannica]
MSFLKIRLALNRKEGRQEPRKISNMPSLRRRISHSAKKTAIALRSRIGSLSRSLHRNSRDPSADRTEPSPVSQPPSEITIPSQAQSSPTVTSRAPVQSDSGAADLDFIPHHAISSSQDTSSSPEDVLFPSFSCNNDTSTVVTAIQSPNLPTADQDTSVPPPSMVSLNLGVPPGTRAPLAHGAPPFAPADNSVVSTIRVLEWTESESLDTHRPVTTVSPPSFDPHVDHAAEEGMDLFLESMAICQQQPARAAAGMHLSPDFLAAVSRTTDERNAINVIDATTISPSLESAPMSYLTATDFNKFFLPPPSSSSPAPPLLPSHDGTTIPVAVRREPSSVTNLLPPASAMAESYSQVGVNEETIAIRSPQGPFRTAAATKPPVTETSSVHPSLGSTSSSSTSLALMIAEFDRAALMRAPSLDHTLSSPVGFSSDLVPAATRIVPRRGFSSPIVPMHAAAAGSPLAGPVDLHEHYRTRLADAAHAYHAELSALQRDRDLLAKRLAHVEMALTAATPQSPSQKSWSGDTSLDSNTSSITTNTTTTSTETTSLTSVLVTPERKKERAKREGDHQRRRKVSWLPEDLATDLARAQQALDAANKEAERLRGENTRLIHALHDAHQDAMVMVTRARGLSEEALMAGMLIGQDLHAVNQIIGEVIWQADGGSAFAVAAEEGAAARRVVSLAMDGVHSGDALVEWARRCGADSDPGMGAFVDFWPRARELCTHAICELASTARIHARPTLISGDEPWTGLHTPPTSPLTAQERQQSALPRAAVVNCEAIMAVVGAWIGWISATAGHSLGTLGN